VHPLRVSNEQSHQSVVVCTNRTSVSSYQ
jgi:hypothetical protein